MEEQQRLSVPRQVFVFSRGCRVDKTLLFRAVPSLSRENDVQDAPIAGALHDSTVSCYMPKSLQRDINHGVEKATDYISL